MTAIVQRLIVVYHSGGLGSWKSPRSIKKRASAKKNRMPKSTASTIAASMPSAASRLTSPALDPCSSRASGLRIAWFPAVVMMGPSRWDRHDGTVTMGPSRWWTRLLGPNGCSHDGLRVGRSEHVLRQRPQRPGARHFVLPCPTPQQQRVGDLRDRGVEAHRAHAATVEHVSRHAPGGLPHDGAD